MLALAVLAVVIVIVLIVVRPGASSEDTAAQPPAADAAETTTMTPTTAAVTTPTAAVPVTGQQICQANQIDVEAISDSNAYEPGVQPQLSLTITNTGPAPCTINAGTGAQVFSITSGSDIYWSSTHCQTNPVDTPVVLQPGVAISSASPVTWDRTRSAPDTCEGAREEVPASGASYYLKTSVDGIESTVGKQFLLY